MLPLAPEMLPLLRETAHNNLQEDERPRGEGRVIQPPEDQPGQPKGFNRLTGRVNQDNEHFSRSVMSDSLRPHGLQHVRPPCTSLSS